MSTDGPPGHRAVAHYENADRVGAQPNPRPCHAASDRWVPVPRPTAAAFGVHGATGITMTPSRVIGSPNTIAARVPVELAGHVAAAGALSYSG